MSEFDISEYVREKSNGYLIFRLVDLKDSEVAGKRYKTQPIIGEHGIVKYLIFADISVFRYADKKVGNAFVDLFSKKVGRQKFARDKILNFAKNCLETDLPLPVRAG